jgi:hypothetical protein
MNAGVPSLNSGELDEDHLEFQTSLIFLETSPEGDGTKLAQVLFPAASLHSSHRIVIPTGAKRSGGICGYFPLPLSDLRE